MSHIYFTDILLHCIENMFLTQTV